MKVMIITYDDDVIINYHCNDSDDDDDDDDDHVELGCHKVNNNYSPDTLKVFVTR